MPPDSIKILCTLGPATMNESMLSRLEGLGANLFRINLSHTKAEALPGIIDFIQSHTSVPVCLDTEGAQVRTGQISGGSVIVNEHHTLTAYAEPIEGTKEAFSFYPEHVVESLIVGDFISIDFNSVLVQVIDKAPGVATLRVLNGGQMGSNKAVTVQRDIPLSPLTDKDLKALAIGAEKGIENIALSFANRAEDVDEIRAVFGKPAFVISKIECRNGLTNLVDIAQKSDAILIDRGDLSREVPIEQIPLTQKKIIQCAKSVGRPVYVATNLLETMIDAPAPTRAEVNDIYNTLIDGADGLVLAAETAIGKHPIACASMIVKMVHEYERRETERSGIYPVDPKSLLIEPHGGQLVHREATEAECEKIDQYPALVVKDTDLMDCQQIAYGTYSPLTGFMGRDDLESVLDHNRMNDGTVWTLPIVLQVADDSLPVGERVVLTDADGAAHAFLDVSDVFRVNLPDIARRWFTTDSLDHPGAERLLNGGTFFVAGDVTLIEGTASPFADFELTPAQSRFIFTHKGWSRVVGFHTRNVAHRVHEYIQMAALSRSHADGLYISPVIGPKKANDFLPDPIMRSYQTLIESGVYPDGKVVLGSFATYSRYSGPREAVFTALCRKNLGCSHFIIGRDHTGVGDFYPADANKTLFDALGDIGIVPIFFDAIGYDVKTEAYGPSTESNTLTHISGTQVRASLKNGDRLPDWFIRPEVQQMLFDALSQGEEIFSA
jgi:ATP sulfurylase